MNFSQLQYVKKVVETGSFSRAAASCFVTQPSLSNAIAQLEKELGGRIFFRTTHNVSLTPFGEKLLPLIESVLDAKDDLLKTVKSYVNPEHKLLRIGFCPSINVSLLAAALEPFKKSNPGVEIVLREFFVGDLKDRLENFKIDFAVVPETFRMKKLGQAFFYDEPLYYLPKESESKILPGANGRACLEEIAGETFAVTGDGCGLADALRDLFKSRKLELKEYAGQALSYAVLEDWAALGIGAAILPKSKISGKNKKARPLFLAGGIPAKIVFRTVWNENASQSESYKLFMRYFKKSAPQYVKGLYSVSGA